MKTLVALFASSILLSACATSTIAPVEDRSMDFRQPPAQQASAPVAATPSNWAATPTPVTEFITVKRGDTLYSISYGLGLDFAQVAVWNSLDANFTIYPGQLLRIAAPQSSTRTQAVATANSNVAVYEQQPVTAQAVAAYPSNQAASRATEQIELPAGEGALAASDVSVKELSQAKPTAAPVDTGDPNTVAFVDDSEAVLVLSDSSASTSLPAASAASIESSSIESSSIATSAQAIASNNSAAANNSTVATKTPTQSKPSLSDIVQSDRPALVAKPLASEPTTLAASNPPATAIVVTEPSIATANIQQPGLPPVQIVSGQSRSVAGLNWRWPAQGGLVGRFVAGDPIKRGVTIQGTQGAHVIASADGEVVYSGNALPGFGEMIVIRHNAEYLSTYGHNRKRLVNEGDKVKAGQVIAEMGSSPTMANTLHFEVRRNAKPEDPLKYLPPR